MAKKSIVSTKTDSAQIRFIVEGAGEFGLPFTALTDDIRHRALVHGLVQKISDAAAMPKADLPTDPAEAAKVKFAAMQSVAERLADGDWSKRAEGGTGPVSGIILRAYTEWVHGMAKKAKTTKTDAEIKAVYDAKTRAEQLALRNVPEIAAIIERIKSERGDNAAKSVDTSALLGELGIG